MFLGLENERIIRILFDAIIFQDISKEVLPRSGSSSISCFVNFQSAPYETFIFNRLGSTLTHVQIPQISDLNIIIFFYYPFNIFSTTTSRLRLAVCCVIVVGDHTRFSIRSTRPVLFRTLLFF